MSFFLNYSAEDYEYLLTPAGYVLLTLIMLLVLLSTHFIERKKTPKMSTKSLVYCSAAMALATVTSFIKFGSLPFGGSITLFSMFFVCFIGYLYGPTIGITTGIAYGLLQLVVEPYIFHPLQVILDYPLAFGCLGLSGFFMSKKHGLAIGYVVAVIGRYLCHVVSGYLFFAEYAPENMNPFVYTLYYNATYLVPELILTLILLFIPAVMKGLGQVKKMATE
ncbi:MAG: energy-coupled thiamine transporter ThiT [Lachnospiraceae bacterium]|nr:energy-coupled thiamine transporter ThiT [Lachnospiraceae bacterium]